MSEHKPKIRVMEKLSLNNLNETANEVIENEEFNVTHDSDIKIFFGHPKDGKEMKLAGIGVGAKDSSELVLIVEPMGDNMIDELISLLQKIKDSRD